MLNDSKLIESLPNRFLAVLIKIRRTLSRKSPTNINPVKLILPAISAYIGDSGHCNYSFHIFLIV